MGEIKFTIKWKEDLEAVSDEGRIVFEITMGTLHVYFPDEPCWLAGTPNWANDKWKLYLDACTQWCKENKIPMTIVDNARIFAEKKDG